MGPVTALAFVLTIGPVSRFQRSKQVASYLGLNPSEERQNISCPIVVEVEYCARFPWSGGRHPWLDALAETPEAIIGIESKRFEPYRGPKDVELSTAYDRLVWHDHMAAYEHMRDRLRSPSGALRFSGCGATGEACFRFGDRRSPESKGALPCLFVRGISRLRRKANR